MDGQKERAGRTTAKRQSACKWESCKDPSWNWVSKSHIVIRLYMKARSLDVTRSSVLKHANNNFNYCYPIVGVCTAFSIWNNEAVFHFIKCTSRSEKCMTVSVIEMSSKPTFHSYISNVFLGNSQKKFKIADFLAEHPLQQQTDVLTVQQQQAGLLIEPPSQQQQTYIISLAQTSL